MNKLESILSKWNFKKIAIAYVIITIIAAISCLSVIGFIFYDRINFAWQYKSLDESIEKYDPAGLQTQIDKLAFSSSDIVDILILDTDNHISYSAKGSVFGTGTFKLTESEKGKSFLTIEGSSDVAFKYVKGDAFMLTSILNKDFGEIRREYDDEHFYENDFSNNTVYMLSFLGDKHSTSKVYIISQPTSVPGGMMVLKACACVAMFFFMLYWVLVALWTYKDASKKKLYPLFWGFVVLLTNVAGVLVYLIYKKGLSVCPDCGSSQNKAHMFCTICGHQLGEVCKICGAQISEKDLFCAHCGKQIDWNEQKGE